jgi:hypothetical protein
MSADEYLQRILARESVDTGPYSPVRGVQALVMPALQEWGGQYIRFAQPSGSFAKGTANKSGTDIDLFVSLLENVPNTMKETYNTLFNKVSEKGYQPKRRNVSINITVAGYSVDLVPAKRQNGYGEDHSLYRRRADSWTKTNVTIHINHVMSSGCSREIRIIKLWRDQKGLDFPSFIWSSQLSKRSPAQAAPSLSACGKSFNTCVTRSRPRVSSILPIPITSFQTI